MSTPLHWDEVEEAPAAATPLVVRGAREVLERVEERGDLFAPVLEREQELPDL